MLTSLLCLTPPLSEYIFVIAPVSFIDFWTKYYNWMLRNYFFLLSRFNSSSLDLLSNHVLQYANWYSVYRVSLVITIAYFPKITHTQTSVSITKHCLEISRLIYLDNFGWTNQLCFKRLSRIRIKESLHNDGAKLTNGINSALTYSGDKDLDVLSVNLLY